jgi:Asp-tRNA(Asn)/Glu-tRNA(Gln) amidotransferase A subunit family amidase
MTRSTLDAALMLQSIAGIRRRRSHELRYACPGLCQCVTAAAKAASPHRPGANYFYDALDSQIKHVVDAAVSTFGKLGAEIHDVALPASSDRTVI